MRVGLRRLRANVFEAWLGFLTILIVVQYLLRPNPVTILYGNWDWLWRGAYGASGVLILVGIWFGRVDWEAAGLIVFAGGAAANAVALLSLGPGYQVAAVLGTAPTLTLVMVCASRVSDILHGKRVLSASIEAPD